MVEIGARPILGRIKGRSSHRRYNNFVILLGYRDNCVARYIVDYFLYANGCNSLTSSIA